MPNPTPRDFRPLGGSARRYLNLATGETLSRRQYDQLFRLPAQGFSSYEEKAVARRAPRESTIGRFYGVVRRLTGGERSVTRAARAEHISLATIHRINRQRGTFSPRYVPGRTGRNVRMGYTVDRAAGRASFWTSDLVFHDGVVFDRQMLSLLAHYDNDVQRAMARNDQRLLDPYASTFAYDVYGAAYRPLTDLNALYAVHAAAEPMDLAPLFASEEVLLSGH
jgi:hypothetical protein